MARAASTGRKASPALLCSWLHCCTFTIWQGSSAFPICAPRRLKVSVKRTDRQRFKLLYRCCSCFLSSCFVLSVVSLCFFPCRQTSRGKNGCFCVLDCIHSQIITSPSSSSSSSSFTPLPSSSSTAPVYFVCDALVWNGVSFCDLSAECRLASMMMIYFWGTGSFWV